MLNSIFSAHLDFSPPTPKSCSHLQNTPNYTINTFTSFPSTLPDTISDNAQDLPWPFPSTYLCLPLAISDNHPAKPKNRNIFSHIYLYQRLAYAYMTILHSPRALPCLLYLKVTWPLYRRTPDPRHEGHLTLGVKVTWPLHRRSRDPQNALYQVPWSKSSVTNDVTLDCDVGFTRKMLYI